MQLDLRRERRVRVGMESQCVMNAYLFLYDMKLDRHLST